MTAASDAREGTASAAIPFFDSRLAGIIHQTASTGNAPARSSGLGAGTRGWGKADHTVMVVSLRRLTNHTLSGTIRNMRKATRFSKSFTIDRSILDYLQRTRSSRSRSERVNELLRRAILEEQYEALEREAAEFFAAAGETERAERKAFAAASRRAITREGE